MRGAIAPVGMGEEEVMEKVRAHPLMEGLDLAWWSLDRAAVLGPCHR